MTDREKLIELIEYAEGMVNNDIPTLEQIADYLIAHGVTIPVRCKDCKHRYFNEYMEEYCCEQWADGFDTVCTDEEFCSRGERKDDGI